MRPSIVRHSRLAADLARASLGPVALPFKLTLCLTWRCHHRCAACQIWSRPAGDEMSVAQLDRLFASMNSISWLDLTGGEVVARRDLGEIAASIHRRLGRLAMVHFPTAGMRPEQVVAAARAFVRPGGPRVVISVSVDGPPPLHDRLRGVPGAWHRAVDSLVALREIDGVRAFAGMTLQPGNTDAIDATVQALADRLPGFKHADLHVNYQHRSAHYFGNEGLLPPDGPEVSAALADFVGQKGTPRNPFEVVERLYLGLAPRHLATGRSPVPCRSAELSAYVSPDGTVYACTIDPRPMGRLADFDFDLRRLWQSAERRRLRQEVAQDRCPGCWTPCEAYQTLLTSPLTLALALRRGR